MHCVRAWVSGRVQGVFFRECTARKARTLGLTGCAENLPDGRVEVVVEGTHEEIEAFITEIRRRMAAYISECSVNRRDATGGFDGFDIRY